MRRESAQKRVEHFVMPMNIRASLVFTYEVLGGEAMESAIDYREEALAALFERYKERYSSLEDSCSGEACVVEYGKGGTMLHRGFYCPSPVIDIVVGGSERGRLVRNPKNAASYDYAFRKTKDGRLRIVDQYGLAREGREPYRREFLIYSEKRIEAPIFEIISGRYALVYLSLCEYDAQGRIAAYRTMLPAYWIGDGTTLDLRKCTFYAEDYSYDAENGLLLSVRNGEKTDALAFETAYRFYHDDEGRLSSYQSISQGGGGAAHPVPRARRRKV